MSPSTSLGASAGFNPSNAALFGPVYRLYTPSFACQVSPFLIYNIYIMRNIKLALDQIDELKKAIRSSKWQNGALLDLTGLPAGTEQILMGDLHTRQENLQRILDANGNLGKIRAGKAVLIILGDAVHSETDLYKMDSSVEIMQAIMDLKISNPDNVFYLIGNHDYLSDNVLKNNIKQGKLYRERMEILYGNLYVRRYNAFIKHSPIVAIGKGYVAVHAGPTLHDISLSKLPKLPVKDEFDPVVNELLWGRYSMGYNLKDVDKFLCDLGQKESSLIVAHHPQDKTGWHWQNASNHHVIYAAHDNPGYASVKDGEIRFIDV